MIKHTAVDGVPTVIAPTSGQLHAGLLFRVGRADETLARAGVTHLVEHLALHPLGLADYHYNGTTGTSITHFHMRGSERDVAAFLTGVCTTLHDLPMHRLDTEREILRTEAAGRGTAITDPLALWRHGARGYGLVGYPEWGLSMLTPEDLRAWAGTYFTRDNAVLWIAGDGVPAGLSLPLPAGQRHGVPAATSALPVTPAYFASDCGPLGWDTVVRRRPAATVFASVLEREMFRALRQESGLSYSAQTDYDPRGDGTVHITAIADSLPEKQDAVLGGFIDVLAKLRVGRVESADVDAVIGKHIEALNNAEVDAARLPTYAFDMLAGLPNRSLDELVTQLRAVTVTDVAEVATEAWAAGLLMVPEGREAGWAGFAEAPSTSDTAVSGTGYRRRDGADHGRLIVADEGVSLAHGGRQLTVHYDRCAAMLAWPDGGRLLIGDDAITVRVEPTLFVDAAPAIAAIDAAVPATHRVNLPARDPDDIPQPGRRRPTPSGEGGSRAGTIALLILLWPLLIGFGGLTFLVTIGAMVEAKDRGVAIVTALFFGALTALLTWGVVRATRRLSRLRR